MKVSEVMTTGVQACSPETNLATVVARMWEANCGLVPIVSEDGMVSGVVTDRDICIALGTRIALSTDVNARDVMTTDVATCYATDDIGTVVKMMRERRVRRLPVVSPSNTLEGVVSLDDLAIRADAGNNAPITYKTVAETLKAICTPTQQTATATK